MDLSKAYSLSESRIEFNDKPSEGKDWQKNYFRGQNTRTAKCGDVWIQTRAQMWCEKNLNNEKGFCMVSTNTKCNYAFFTMKSLGWEIDQSGATIDPDDYGWIPKVNDTDDVICCQKQRDANWDLFTW